jgi:hypothetical protein
MVIDDIIIIMTILVSRIVLKGLIDKGVESGFRAALRSRKFRGSNNLQRVQWP